MDREIAALVCIVALTIISIVLYLLSGLWKRFYQVYSRIESENERKEVRKVAGSMSLVLLLFAITFWIAGVYFPNTIQEFMLLMVFIFIVLGSLWSIGKFTFSKIWKKTSTSSQFKGKLDAKPTFYLLGLSLFIYTITFGLFAIFVISQTMLDVHISPDVIKDYTDYVSGKFLLLGCIILFLSGMLSYGYALVEDEGTKLKNPIEPKTDLK
ncbi:hypothetical protein Dform_00513 [Dehalogenimonas formicexedens]|uniref:Uncharacterized protein n=1 Tax=Dehalogenimonas formicexedens TaxID=1839801 RepID=A0A1P8F602_9CHLR|nr:hypothetical protein [Dehalogenimonas formicexedens]APV43868.1 hypothetical protein Dform_00513 [Dehalogenimonas formicexedens]